MSTAAKPPETTPYTLLPSSEPPPTYVILQCHPQTTTIFRILRRVIILTLSLLLVSLIIYLLYPSNPELRLVRVRLNHIRLHTRTHPPSLDLSLLVTLRVRNRALLSAVYSAVTVDISYRGRQLGFVKSSGGKIRAKQSSYVNATLVLNGFEVLHDFFYLIEDVASGFVPFDTVSTFRGYVGFFFFKIPIKAKVSCEVDVNPLNQKIIHQNCYPELQEAPSPSPM
ncbi:hypothetical protein RND81_08G056500 [Saponaria officinalis]|uniref:Late embryogenesis abundant protein LEA-2 subgroup domain-containing protein n=1 Tax=Saponaria officinalis TaxID=3572 RepID=A0AAW1J3N8_SAPOF